MYIHVTGIYTGYFVCKGQIVACKIYGGPEGHSRLHISHLNPQSLRRHHAKRLHIAYSNPQSLRGQCAKRLHIVLSSLEPPIS